MAREEWSGTLWANLNIQQLTDGIEEFMKKLRKFPKDVKALAVCNVLEERTKEFKDSIPLFADLKNDALRDRSVLIGKHSVYMYQLGCLGGSIGRVTVLKAGGRRSESRLSSLFSLGFISLPCLEI